eukprot:CCRYP_001311-RA/>CCRYP_001311-RA protein AED:0.44 eAED:0.44 QI:0/-1/0/1/-1/1/1/0/307
MEQQHTKWKRRKLNKKQVASIVVNTGATSTCIHQDDYQHVIVTQQDSPKTFITANGRQSKAGKKAVLHYKMRHPATDADTVPGLAMNSLLSAGKLTDANYIAEFTKTDVNIFDAETTCIKADRQAILSGWRCPQTKLWRVPLKPTLSNLNTDTTLITTEATDIMMSNQKHLPSQILQTVCMNSQTRSKSSHGITAQQVTRPKQHGSRPSKKVSTLHGHYSHQKQSNDTFLNPTKHRKATCTASSPASDQPRPSLSNQTLYSKPNTTSPNSNENTRTSTCLFVKQQNWHTQIKQDDSLSSRAKDTSTS